MSGMMMGGGKDPVVGVGGAESVVEGISATFDEIGELMRTGEARVKSALRCRFSLNSSASIDDRGASTFVVSDEGED